MQRARSIRDTLERCTNLVCRDGKVLVRLAGGGTMTSSCTVCGGFGIGQGGAGGRVNPPRGAKRRRNPPPRPLEVKQFGSRRGHLVGSDVFAIEYCNVGSAQRSAYRHDFDGRGIEMWALADGSLLIRHPAHRLWDDFNVSDTE